MKNLKKTGVPVTNCNYWPQYLPNGGVQWLLPKPWTSSIGRCVQYCTSAPPRPSKLPANLVHFLLLFHLLLLWQLLRQYGEISLPMAASSGFQGSPVHAALGDAVCITPAHCHGHQNDWRMRYIRLSLPTFSLTLLVAKDHVMAN
jgi:hypothetical protein